MVLIQLSQRRQSQGDFKNALSAIEDALCLIDKGLTSGQFTNQQMEALAHTLHSELSEQLNETAS